MPGCRVSWLFRRLRKLLKRSVEAARGMAVRASSCDAGEGEVDCTNRGFQCWVASSWDQLPVLQKLQQSVGTALRCNLQTSQMLAERGCASHQLGSQR